MPGTYLSYCWMKINFPGESERGREEEGRRALGERLSLS